MHANNNRVRIVKNDSSFDLREEYIIKIQKRIRKFKSKTR